jgi:hypothetical protein
MRHIDRVRALSVFRAPMRATLVVAAGCLVVAGSLLAMTAGASPSVTNRASVYPGREQVVITPFSKTISGSIGSDTSNVSVSVTLDRDQTLIDTAPTVETDSSGDWTATLPNHVTADQDDTVNVSYSGTGAPIPASTSIGSAEYMDWADAAVIGSGGADITISGCGDCGIYVPVTVKYGSGDTETFEARRDTHGGYETKLSPAVKANDLVTYQPEYYEFANTGDFQLAPVYTASLPGVGFYNNGGEGPPTCDADLVLDTVTCYPLDSGQTYDLTDTRGGSTVSSQTITTSGAPGDPQSGQVTITGLKAGDDIALIAPAASPEPARTLTTLHVYTLRTDIIEGDQHLDYGGDSGSCQPDELITSGEGSLCATDGTFSTEEDNQLTEEDELSGGYTDVSVPYINDTSPIDDELTPTSFVAYADVFDTAGDSFDSTPVGLSVRPLAGSTSVTESGNANSAAGVSVSGLSAGRYVATWKLTDANSDTESLITWFVAEASENGAPGKDGTNGTNGTNGKNGANGKNGTSVEVVCTIKTQGKGKHKKTVRTCTVKQLPAGSKVSLSLGRAKRVYALGDARTSHGDAKVTLHTIRATRKGRYTLTVVVTSHGRATTHVESVTL